MIAIIDYKCGNILSVKNIIKKAGYRSILTNNPIEIKNSDKIILPGVGSFDYGMKKLKELNLVSVIKNHVKKNKPLLGICLGMQLLTKSSEEGLEKGLNLIDAEVLKFQVNKGYPIPHMGWNKIIVMKNNILLDKNKFNKFYFVHSYYVKCNSEKDILSFTDYNIKFVSAFQKNNIFGVQFHPEKSHKYGLSLIKNFIKL